MKPSERLSRLRHATGPLHDRIEAAMGLPEHTLTKDHYVRFLKTWWGFLVPVEAALMPLYEGPEAAALDWPQRQKTPWLERDLLAVGVDSAQIPELPLCPNVPDMQANWARALGCQYVLEGATLGGQVLSRIIRTALPECLPACRFITSYGGDVGRMWNAFLPVLERALAAREDDVIAAACETFETFERWARAQPPLPRT